MFALDRVKEVVKAQPALAAEEPFKTVLSGDRAAIARLTGEDLVKIVGASQAGLDLEAFHEVVRLGEVRQASEVPGGDRTPSSSMRRWSRRWSTCAPTATGPTSSPAAGRSSCARSPRASTACRRSR